jgi:hypothetical protein
VPALHKIETKTRGELLLCESLGMQGMRQSLADLTGGGGIGRREVGKERELAQETEMSGGVDSKSDNCRLTAER